jgi:CubicO group peptidase (beta-lactamase class C family)
VTGLDPDVVVQALALPIVRPPGSTYLYSQRAVDLLVYVTQRAVGMDFQMFAQRKLFDPLGIRQHDYYWARDRSGNTYGYAHLLLPPDDYAKLGLLLLNDGSWRGTRVISSSYLREATSTQSPVGCYGYFILTSGGCGQLSAAPSDAFAMSGLMGQDDLVVPSLGLLITWTGVTGVGTSVLSSHEVVRAITRAFRKPRVPDPAPTWFVRTCR